MAKYFKKRYRVEGMENKELFKGFGDRKPSETLGSVKFLEEVFEEDDEHLGNKYQISGSIVKIYRVERDCAVEVSTYYKKKHEDVRGLLSNILGLELEEVNFTETRK